MKHIKQNIFNQVFNPRFFDVVSDFPVKAVGICFDSQQIYLLNRINFQYKVVNLQRVAKYYFI